MNIRLLKIFRTVCAEGSITKAAEKLYMTQPAVSHAVGELETLTGTPLFDRISRKIYLNETGKIFLQKTLRVLELYEELEIEAGNLKKQSSLKIGSSITIGNFILPKAVKNFQKDCNIPISVEIMSAENILTKLMNNEIDIALVEGVVKENSFKVIPFSVYTLKVVCSKEHRFSKRKEISLEELLRENLLLREKGSAIRDTLDSLLFINGFSCTPTWTSTNSQALIQGVKNNIGISVLPEILLKNEVEKNEIVLLDIKGTKLKNNNSIVIHKDKYINEFMEKFINIILEK